MKSLSDDDVFQVLDEQDLITGVGPAGNAVLVDTSNCLHQGSRARANPRLVFMFQYVPRPDTLLSRDPLRKPVGGHLLITRDMLKEIGYNNRAVASYVD